MLTQLEVISLGIPISPLVVVNGAVATDPIQIRKIDGLGPVPASVNTSQFGSIDGEFYTNSSIGKRNIVLTLGLNPRWADQSMEVLRSYLYQYFMSKLMVKLRFLSTHLPQVEITGYVESFEPNIFSKDPEIQISIVCPQPAFVATDETVIPGVTLALNDSSYTSVIYNGTLPTGFIVAVTKTTNIADQYGEIRLVNETYKTELFDIGTAQVNANTYLEISTNQGNKYARQISVPAGNKTSVLGAQTAGSLWLQLSGGLNKFRILSSVPGQQYNLRYNAKYGGI